MKKLLILLLLAAPQIGQAQGKKEAIILQLMNEYRTSKGLLPVIYDSILSKAAEYQAKYESLVFEVTHNQKIDLPNFNEINSFGDRIFQLSGLSYKPAAEITSDFGSICYSLKEGDTVRFHTWGHDSTGKKYYKGSRLYTFTKNRDKDVVSIMLDSYKNSEGHNKALLLPSDGTLKVGISFRKGANNKIYNVIVFSN
jgi:hypothetical protein